MRESGHGCDEKRMENYADCEEKLGINLKRREERRIKMEFILFLKISEKSEEKPAVVKSGCLTKIKLGDDVFKVFPIDCVSPLLESIKSDEFFPISMSSPVGQAIVGMKNGQRKESVGVEVILRKNRSQ